MYFGQTPGISLVKSTNGDDANSETGPFIPTNGTVVWTYLVTNTGNVNLTNVQIIDDILGLIGTIDLLQPGESRTLTANGNASAGQYANIGNATGKPPIGPGVSDEDPSHYFGESTDIKIKKYTNGVDADNPTGPYLTTGENVTWTYVVTTLSNVPIRDVSVTDSIPGITPVYVSGDDDNNNLLTSNETWIYQANGTAEAGQYANIGSVTGMTPGNNEVKDDDPSHYHAESGEISIKKYTNGYDADYPPGPNIDVGGNVTWRYVVTTASNLSFKDVNVEDSIPGVIPVYVSGDDDGNGLLTSNETWIFEANGTAVAGQYENRQGYSIKSPG